jgi:hypothetical protein
MPGILDTFVCPSMCVTRLVFDQCGAQECQKIFPVIEPRGLLQEISTTCYKCVSRDPEYHISDEEVKWFQSKPEEAYHIPKLNKFGIT